MTEREALKLALKALEDLGMKHYESTGEVLYKETFAAIKEALAQSEHGWTPERIAGIARLKDAQDKKVAQPQPWEKFCDSNCVWTDHHPDCKLAQPAVTESHKQEPVAWLIIDEKINSLQVDSIQRLIDRARHAHMTDIKLRINGQDEWYQADWLKHLTRTTPPQRTWVGLTDEEIQKVVHDIGTIGDLSHDEFDICHAVIAKLKEKNS